MEAHSAQAIGIGNARGSRDGGFTSYCHRHKRKSIIKRWTDAEGYHQLLKCRYCDWYERVDVPLTVSEDATVIEMRRRTVVPPTSQNGTQNIEPQQPQPKPDPENDTTGTLQIDGL